MPKPFYQLKQAQYAEIYQASERTIRNWMQKGEPLDDPHAMFADFLPGKRSLGAETRHLDLLEVEARYQQATYNPEQERQAVLVALAKRLGRLELQVMEARNFARTHQARLPETLADRLQAMHEELDQLHALAGIDEHFDYQQPMRDLNKEDAALFRIDSSAALPRARAALEFLWEDPKLSIHDKVARDDPQRPDPVSALGALD